MQGFSKLNQTMNPITDAISLFTCAVKMPDPCHFDKNVDRKTYLSMLTKVCSDIVFKLKENTDDGLLPTSRKLRMSMSAVAVKILIHPVFTERY